MYYIIFIDNISLLKRERQQRALLDGFAWLFETRLITENHTNKPQITTKYVRVHSCALWPIPVLLFSTIFTVIT